MRQTLPKGQNIRENMQKPPEPVRTAYAEARERLEAIKHNQITDLCTRTGMAYENAKKLIEAEQKRLRYTQHWH
jgi:hypothetical protein